MIEPPYECINKKGKNWRLLTGKYVTNRQNFKNFIYNWFNVLFYQKFFLINKKAYNKNTYAYEVDKINLLTLILCLTTKMQNFFITKNIGIKSYARK